MLIKTKNHLMRSLLLCIGFIYHAQPLSLYGDDTIHKSCSKMTTVDTSKNKDFFAKQCKKQELTYYLYIADFAKSFIQIPTSNISGDSSTISSTYLAGRAPLYNKHNKKIGTCSASFLCMQNEDGIYTDISNFLSVDNGLIVSWFTPTTLINLELDTIIHSMVTKCIVVASTKIGANPFFGKTFNLTVSSDDEKIYFKFLKR